MPTPPSSLSLCRWATTSQRKRPINIFKSPTSKERCPLLQWKRIFPLPLMIYIQRKMHLHWIHMWEAFPLTRWVFSLCFWVACAAVGRCICIPRTLGLSPISAGIPLPWSPSSHIDLLTSSRALFPQNILELNSLKMTPRYLWVSPEKRSLTWKSSAALWPHLHNG